MSEYNGYSNYQTWNFLLWMDNDHLKDAYLMEARELLLTLKAEEFMTVRDLAVYSLEEKLKELAEEKNPLKDVEPSTYKDILNNALANINYRELAEFFVSEVERDLKNE